MNIWFKIFSKNKHISLICFFLYFCLNGIWFNLLKCDKKIRMLTLTTRKGIIHVLGQYLIVILSPSKLRALLVHEPATCQEHY